MGIINLTTRLQRKKLKIGSEGANYVLVDGEGDRWGSLNLREVETSACSSLASADGLMAVGFLTAERVAIGLTRVDS